MIKAILFDLDGVIINSENAYSKAQKETCIEYGINTNNINWGVFKGMSSINIFRSIVQNNNLNIQIVDKLEKSFITIINSDSFYENIEIMANVHKTLESLKQKYRLALVTSSSKEFVYEILKEKGLIHYFEKIVTKDDCKLLKPDPQPYLNCLEQLNLSNNEVVVIEDSEYGVCSAKSANMFCIEFNENPNHCNADAQIKIIEDVFDVLQQIS